MADAGQGIDFLNKAGIYHRDIKPQNLLVFQGRVKLGDLGLAKLVGASTGSHTGSGTLGYLPPEAYEEHRLHRTIDLYSLAATYIKLRSGGEPFGENPLEAVQRQMRGEPIVEGLHPAEAEVVRRALAAKAEERPQDGVQAWVRTVYEALRSGSKAAATGTGREEIGVAGSAVSTGSTSVPLKVNLGTVRAPQCVLPSLRSPIYFVAFRPEGGRGGS